MIVFNYPQAKDLWVVPFHPQGTLHGIRNDTNLTTKKLISNKVLTKKIITIFTFNNNEKKTIMIENPFEFGITVDGDTVSFNDPFFKLWIRRNIAQL